MQLAGIHHLTAISAKPRENLAFYTAPARHAAGQERDVAHRLGADRGHEHAPCARLCRPWRADSCVRDGRGKRRKKPCRRTARDRTRIRRWRNGAPAACITSPSAPRMRCSITPGRSGSTSCAFPTAARSTASFRSPYFREPSGILFEIATDGPGFATDEPMGHARRETGAAAVPGTAAHAVRYVRKAARCRSGENLAAAPALLRIGNGRSGMWAAASPSAQDFGNCLLMSHSLHTACVAQGRLPDAE